MHFLVFQHISVEHPGAFCDLWREAGVEWRAIELDAGEPIPTDLSDFDAMVVMGGPMDVWQTAEHPWLIPEIAAIRSFVVELGRPFLGVCLGHQLLAKAIGGDVALARASEVGPCSVRLTPAGTRDAVLGRFAPTMTTFQWHSAEVTELPSDAIVLAETELCRVQAFRWRTCAYGLQFHAELTANTVPEWGAVPAYRRSLEATLGVGGADRLERETSQLLPGFNRTARMLNDAFLDVVRASRRVHAAAL